MRTDCTYLNLRLTVKVFVRNIDADVDGDEFYWDDEENVKKAVDEADEEDIEIV